MQMQVCYIDDSNNLSGTVIADEMIKDENLIENFQINKSSLDFYCSRMPFEKKKKSMYWGFPGGPVVKNPPCNAGNTSSIPGPGRFHMQWGN